MRTVLALTGIRQEALRKLETKGSVVLELISFVNVRTAVNLREGDRVFVTSDLYEELASGSEGIVVEVERVEVSPVRISMEHVDERELQRARVKLKFVSYGRVRNVTFTEESPVVELIVLENHIIV